VEPAGSHVGDSAFPTTTQTGTITFNSADGVLKIELGNLTLDSATPSGSIVDATGRLTASFTYDPATGSGTVHYSYVLLDNTVGIPNVSFAVAVTDGDGDRTAGGDLVINVIDDSPEALADNDTVAPGQVTEEIGNVITGQGTSSGAADVVGADGAVVAGVVAGVSIISIVDPITVNTRIDGQFGTLTLAADGTYSYVRNAGAPGGVFDTFTYTIQDADGDVSFNTLTMALAASSAPGHVEIPPPGLLETRVFETGLPARTIGGTPEPAGSLPGAPAFPVTTLPGSITFSSPDGVRSVSLGGLVLTVEGQLETITDATGSHAIPE
jgi:hypothetical protein